MTRKAIPEETQTSILLKSRRRCCLCFWLKGEDEVKKGQIAHLDGDHANCAEDNLAFMCFEHHDEYDSTTRISKGLREPEVKRWRDELYKEMEHRFRTIKKRNLELTLVQFKSTIYPARKSDFSAEFRLKNTGEMEVRSPTVSICLPNDIRGRPPRDPLDPNASRDMMEVEEDLFEVGGRVAIIRPMPLVNPVLLRGHSVSFFGLALQLSNYPLSSSISLEYRIDAEDMAPVVELIRTKIPDNESNIFNY